MRTVAAWFAFGSFVLIAGIAIAAFVRGDDLSLSSDGRNTGITVSRPPSAGSEDVAAEPKADLNQVRDELQDELRSTPVADVADQGGQFDGVWVHRPSGFRYRIISSGSIATIEEIDSFNNVTAAGSGLIEGSRFSFEFQNAWGMFGTGYLDIANRQLIGELSSPNGTQPIVLS